MQCLKKNTYLLTYVCLIVGAMIFVASCKPEVSITKKPSGENNDNSPATSVFEHLDKATHAAFESTENFIVSAQTLLKSTTTDEAFKTVAEKLYQDAKALKDNAIRVRDAAKKIVEEIENAEKSTASGSIWDSVLSSVVSTGKNAKLVAAKATLDIAEKALTMALSIYTDVTSVRNQANIGHRDTTTLQAIMKNVKLIKVSMQQVEFVNKNVESTVKMGAETHETLVLVGEGIVPPKNVKSDDTYETTLEADAATLVIKDVGVGAGVLDAKYKSGGAGDNKFDITKNGRTITFTPKKGDDTPKKGSYVYTISKVKTGDNTPAKDVIITIVVQTASTVVSLRKETIALNTASAVIKTGATDGVVIEDSGLGAGALDAQYTSGAGDNKFDITKNGGRITFTPKTGDDAPIVGTYTYIVSKAAESGNTAADEVAFVIRVIEKIKESIALVSESGSLFIENISKTGLVIKDEGVGTGALNLQSVVIKGDATNTDKKHTFTIGVDKREIRLIPKSGLSKPIPGKYIVTVSKASTEGKVIPDATVEFVITGQQEDIKLDKTSGEITVGLEPITFTDNGIGEGELEARLLMGNPEIKMGIARKNKGRTLVFTLKTEPKLSFSYSYDFTYVISKKVTGTNIKAPDVRIRIQVTVRGTQTLSFDKQSVSMLEDDTNGLDLSFWNLDATPLSTAYKSGPGDDKFVLTSVTNKWKKSLLKIMPQKGTNKPTPGTYVYTARKEPTHDLHASDDVEITIQVYKFQETIDFNNDTAWIVEDSTKPIVFADRGIGGGKLSVVYNKDRFGNGDGKFTIESKNGAIHFIPKMGSDKPAVGNYIYTISKEVTAGNKAASNVDVTIKVKRKFDFLQNNVSIADTESAEFFDISDWSLDSRAVYKLDAEYTSGPGDEKFTIELKNRTLHFTPKVGSDVPPAGRYVYTATKKVSLGKNSATSKAEIIITVRENLKEFISFKTNQKSMREGESAPIVFTDSARWGTGLLRAEYTSGSGNDKFAIRPENRTLRFTPKSGSNAPTRGRYTYTVSKARTGRNRAASSIEITIVVMGQETIILDENEKSMIEGAHAPIVFTDSGIGSGLLNIWFKHENFDVVARGRSISFTPKRGVDHPTPDEYVFKIDKAVTADNLKAATVEVRIRVQLQEVISLSEFRTGTRPYATVNSSGISYTLPLEKINKRNTRYLPAIRDTGAGGTWLIVRFISGPGDFFDLRKDKQGRSFKLLRFSNDDKRVTKGTYVYTVSKQVKPGNLKAKDVTITIKVE